MRNRHKAIGDWQAHTQSLLAHLSPQKAEVDYLTRVARTQQACLVCFEADFRYCHRTSVARAAHHAVAPRRDGTTHLVMSPLEFNAEWQLFGSQICERYVG